MAFMQRNVKCLSSKSSLNNFLTGIILPIYTATKLQYFLAFNGLAMSKSSRGFVFTPIVKATQCIKN